MNLKTGRPYRAWLLQTTRYLAPDWHIVGDQRVCVEWQIESHFPGAKGRRCYTANSNKVLCIPVWFPTVSPAPRTAPTADGSYSRTVEWRRDGEREREKERKKEKKEEEGEREGGRISQSKTHTFSRTQIQVQLNCYSPSLTDKATLLETESKKTHCSESILRKTQTPGWSTSLRTSLCAYHPHLEGKCPLDLADLTTNLDSLFINLCFPKEYLFM